MHNIKTISFLQIKKNITKKRMLKSFSVLPCNILQYYNKLFKNKLGFQFVVVNVNTCIKLTTPAKVQNKN